MLIFVEGGKPENPEKNPRSRVENNNKLNPHDAGSGSRTWVTAVGGECSRHCAIPAPQGGGCDATQEIFASLSSLRGRLGISILHGSFRVKAVIAP